MEPEDLGSSPGSAAKVALIKEEGKGRNFMLLELASYVFSHQLLEVVIIRTIDNM